MGKPKPKSTCYVGFYANEARAFPTWPACSDFSCGKGDRPTHNFKIKTIEEAQACAAWINELCANSTLSNTECKSLRQKWLDQPRQMWLDQQNAPAPFSPAVTRSHSSRRAPDSPELTKSQKNVETQKSSGTPTTPDDVHSPPTPSPLRRTRTRPATPIEGALRRPSGNQTPNIPHRKPMTPRRKSMTRTQDPSSLTDEQRLMTSQAMTHIPDPPRPGTPPTTQTSLPVTPDRTSTKSGNEEAQSPEHRTLSESDRDTDAQASEDESNAGSPDMTDPDYFLHRLASLEKKHPPTAESDQDSVTLSENNPRTNRRLPRPPQANATSLLGATTGTTTHPTWGALLDHHSLTTTLCTSPVVMVGGPPTQGTSSFTIGRENQDHTSPPGLEHTLNHDPSDVHSTHATICYCHASGKSTITNHNTTLNTSLNGTPLPAFTAHALTDDDVLQLGKDTEGARLIDAPLLTVTYNPSPATTERITAQHAATMAPLSDDSPGTPNPRAGGAAGGSAPQRGRVANLLGGGAGVAPVARVWPVSQVKEMVAMYDLIIGNRPGTYAPLAQHYVAALTEYLATSNMVERTAHAHNDPCWTNPVSNFSLLAYFVEHFLLDEGLIDGFFVGPLRFADNNGPHFHAHRPQAMTLFDEAFLKMRGIVEDFRLSEDQTPSHGRPAQTAAANPDTSADEQGFTLVTRRQNRGRSAGRQPSNPRNSGTLAKPPSFPSPLNRAAHPHTGTARPAIPIATFEAGHSNPSTQSKPRSSPRTPSLSRTASKAAEEKANAAALERETKRKAAEKIRNREAREKKQAQAASERKQRELCTGCNHCDTGNPQGSCPYKSCNMHGIHQPDPERACNHLNTHRRKIDHTKGHKRWSTHEPHNPPDALAQASGMPTCPVCEWSITPNDAANNAHSCCTGPGNQPGLYPTSALTPLPLTDPVEILALSNRIPHQTLLDAFGHLSIAQVVEPETNTVMCPYMSSSANHALSMVYTMLLERMCSPSITDAEHAIDGVAIAMIPRLLFWTSPEMHFAGSNLDICNIESVINRRTTALFNGDINGLYTQYTEQRNAAQARRSSGPNPHPSTTAIRLDKLCLQGRPGDGVRLAKQEVAAATSGLPPVSQVPMSQAVQQTLLCASPAQLDHAPWNLEEHALGCSIPPDLRDEIAQALTNSSIIDEATVRKALTVKLPNRKGAGPTGTRKEHLELLASDRHCCRALASMLSLVVKHGVDHLPTAQPRWVAFRNLITSLAPIAFDKPGKLNADGTTKLRFIGNVCMWAKLALKGLATQSHAYVATRLALTSTTYEPDGCAATAVKAQLYLQGTSADNAKTWAKMESATDTERVAEMKVMLEMDALRQYCMAKRVPLCNLLFRTPEALPLLLAFCFMYGNPLTLYFYPEGQDPTSHPLVEGLAIGDELAGLLSALLLATELEAIKSAHPEVWKRCSVSAHADNVTICGSLADATLLMHALQTSSQWSFPSDDITIIAQIPPPPSSPTVAPYTPPTTFALAAAPITAPAAPPTTGIWTAAVDEATGRTYYWHSESRKTQWKEPANPQAQPQPHQNQHQHQHPHPQQPR